MKFDTHKAIAGKDGFKRKKTGVTVVVRVNEADNYLILKKQLKTVIGKLQFTLTKAHMQQRKMILS
jgi:hypothetical protein